MQKDITTKEMEDRQIAIGLTIEEFFKGKEAGIFLLDMWDQKKALTCVEGMLGKHQKSESKGEYKCGKLEDFYLQRGIALGLQIALDDINSLINVAKRLVKDREKQS